MKSFDAYRILILPDHATPIEVRTHTDEPVPFVIYDNRKRYVNKGVSFDEMISTKKDALFFEKGHTLMDYFIKGKET